MVLEAEEAHKIMYIPTIKYITKKAHKVKKKVFLAFLDYAMENTNK